MSNGGPASNFVRTQGHKGTGALNGTLGYNPLSFGVLLMEVKTQDLERVLEALSPTLAAELNRVVVETRETLEREFQISLQTAIQAAVHDAELAAGLKSHAELERA